MSIKVAHDFCPKVGEVYVMQFDGCGSEQSGFRPGIVFSNNIGNAYSPNIIAIPLTSSLKKLDLPTHVLIRSNDSGLARDSVALCENPQRMSKEKVGKYITTLSNNYLKQITEANLIASSAISFMDIESLISVWERAIRMNAQPVRGGRECA